MNRNILIREQLEVSLQRLAPLHGINPPTKGWVRAIRDALGMTARQLAGRLGVSQQSVARIEKDELSGSVTVKTLRHVAESLDCVFVCGFVPRSSLETTLRKQAELIASRRLAQASQTMTLEDQGLNAGENKKVLTGMVDEMVEQLPSELWDE